MEEINARRQFGACQADVQHGTRCGTDRSRKAEILPKIASGELRLQSMAVTEPRPAPTRQKIKTRRRRRTPFT